VLDLLEFFRETRQPARATEISRALGLPNSSVDKILKTLVRRGYLVFDLFSKRYAPAYRIIRTIGDIEAAFYGGPVLRRIIEDLHAETGATVCLCVQNDCWVQNVASVAGARYVPSIHGEGIRAPILGSAPGNAMMALRNDREILDIAQRAAERGYLDVEPKDFGELLEAVNRVRQEGFAAWRGFSSPGAIAIAVAIRPAAHVAAAAVVLMSENPSRSRDRELELGALVRRVVARHLPE
jgi:DNA-binding IclR family transcriptional regulator